MSSRTRELTPPSRKTRSHLIHIATASNASRLWDVCVDAFLERGGSPTERGGSPTERGAWIWLSHRNLRDRLLESAHAAGHAGWLDPPITFFGDLAGLFDIREKPVGLLTRRRILSRHAARLGHEILGRKPGRADGVIRGHMLDSVLADLVPEGVTPDELETALGRLEGDDFARRRNRWIVEVYRAYLASLDELGLRDWRSANALLAERIEAGDLRRVLRGAGELHIYGITTSRTRRRFLEALADQDDVEVFLYLPSEPEPDPFFAEIAAEVRSLGGEGERPAAEPRVQPVSVAGPCVQPAPDAAREMAWVARRVKELLAAGKAEPHEIAVVARSGREDTRRAVRALSAAGVPATARIRTPLSEIAALKALLLAFRGAGRGWDYRSLRAVLEHPYFDTRVDLRAIDFIAGRRRVTGLASWQATLEQLLGLVEAESREVRGQGLYADRLAKDIEAFGALREALDPLSEERSEAEWIELTRELLVRKRGLLMLRRRLCDAVEDRWEVVRADQRGVVQLERLLGEWGELDPSDEPMAPAAWHALLRKLLEANELVLSTPGQKGVQVLEAHDAALVPFAHTFLVHANDGEFPRVGGSTGVLTDEERVTLAEQGVFLSHRDDDLRRERTLWRAVTQQAGPVWISYRTTDAGGTPLLPSLMVPEHDPSNELPRVRRPGSEEHPVTPAEADRLAAATLGRRLGGLVSAPGGVHPARPERIRRAIVGAVAEVHRGPGLERYPGTGPHPALAPNPWNGQLRDPEVLAKLAERFGEDYRWSASQLERYAKAPFVFMVERVLWLRTLEEAEEETTPLTFGSVAHEILERFYREHLDSLPFALEGAAAARLDEIADDVYREREERGEWMGLPSLWATSRETVRRSVREYVAWELGHIADKGERPAMIELEFGFDDERVFLVGTDVHGRQARLRLCGRIDRVDVSGADVHHVLDYKSGSTPGANDYEDATVLQGALYLQVLADRGHAVKLGRYRSIKSPGKPQNGGLIKHGTEKFEAALALAFAIPARARTGHFEPVASRKGGWKDWDIGIEIRRNAARLAEGHRFEIDPRSPASSVVCACWMCAAEGEGADG